MKLSSATVKWSAIEKRLKEAEYFYLFLDYDGTLTPIAATPQEAVLSPEVKGLLQKLLKCPHCKLAIITGRSLDDIKTRVALKNVVYVGNHGFEIEGGDLKFNSLITPKLRNIFEEKKEVKGLSVEMKEI